MTRLEKANIRRAFRALLDDARTERNEAVDKKDNVLFASAQGYLNGIDVAYTAMSLLMKQDDV